MLPHILVMLCVVAGLDARPARAQEKKRALVMPTELGGIFLGRSEWRREFNAALENRLTSSRYIVAGADKLTKAETECGELACLKAIAKAHGVDVVVAGRVVNDEQRLTSYHVRVRLVERQADGELAGREREASCPNCTEKDAKNMLATVMSAALANEPEPVPVPVEPVPSPTPNGSKIPPLYPPAVDGHKIVKPTPPPEDRLTHQQRLVIRGVGFGLVGVGILGIIQGFVELSHNGDRVDANKNGGCGSTCGYALVTTDGQKLFFSLGAVTAVVGGALAVLSWWPLPKKRHEAAVRLTPELSPTTARLQLEVSF